MKTAVTFFCFAFCTVNNFAQAPVISSFNPATGPVGTSVVIKGTGFNTTKANNIVYFGATRATVSVANATSLTVKVPAGATYQPVTVLNTANGLMASSNSPFVTTFTPTKEAVTAADMMPRVDIITATQGLAVAFGDIDGDGRADMIMANNSADAISVYRNTSVSGTIDNNTFAPNVDFAAGDGPTSIALADLDGDGKLDIVTTNYNSNTISVLKNTATPGNITVNSLQAKTDFTTGSHPNGVAAGDVDADGKADIIVSNYSSSSFSVFKNTSVAGTITTGSFAAKVDFSIGSGASTVVISDLDLDGKPDLAIVVPNAVTVLKNNTTSGTINSNSFVPGTNIAIGSSVDVAAGDMNGDSKPELVIVSHTYAILYVMENKSTPGVIDNNSFKQQIMLFPYYLPDKVVLGDIDGDGSPDVMTTIAGTVSVFRNNSDGYSLSFAAKTDFLTSESGLYSLAAADIDNDGRLDLVSAGYPNIISLIRNQPVFPPSISGFSPDNAGKGGTVTINGNAFLGATNVSFGGTPALSFSVNSDQKITAVVADGASGDVYVANGAYAASLAGFTFNSTAPAITKFSPTSGAPGTFVTITGTNFSSVKANNIVYFGATRATLSSASATSLKVAVPAGATYQPITVLNTETGQMAATKNSFVPTFTPVKNGVGPEDIIAASNLQDVAPSYYASAIGDLDDDGKPDLAVVNINANTVSVFRNTSVQGTLDDNSFATPVNFPTYNYPQSVVISDLDADGKPDLVISCGGYVSVLKNNSVPGVIDGSSFGTRADFFAAPVSNQNGRSVAVGDVDGDGKPDIAVTNTISNSISVLRNIATPGLINNNSFVPAINFGVSGPQSITMSDIDGDSKPDLVIANSGYVTILKNTSSSGIISSNSFGVPVLFKLANNLPGLLAIGDLNKDGKPDIVVSNSYFVSLYTNTSIPGVLNSNSLADRVDVFNNPSGSIVPAVIVDLDGDAMPDLVFADNSNKKVFVLKNTSIEGNNTITFSDTTNVISNLSSSNIVAGDIDGDGKPDLAIVSAGTSVRIYQNNPQLPVITTAKISTGTLCSGSTIQVPFTVSLPCNDGNVFSAQLSDAKGSFAKPVVIGFLSGTNSDTITATIPSDTVTGSKYRIRVVSTNPAITGSDNGKNLTRSVSPILVITNPIPVCSPNTISLKAGKITSGSTAGLAYTYWTDVAATIAYPYPGNADMGIYYIKGTAASGCYDIKPVTVKIDPIPVVSIQPSPCFLCNSSTILNTNAASTLKFLWSTGDTTKSIPITQPGAYTVTVTDSIGCTASAGTQVTPYGDCGGYLQLVADYSINYFDTITVQVKISGALNIFSTYATLKFDNSKMTLFDAKVGNFLGAEKDIIYTDPVVSYGSIDFGMTKKAGQGGRTGSGKIYTFRFILTKIPGTTTFNAFYPNTFSTDFSLTNINCLNTAKVQPPSFQSLSVTKATTLCIYYVPVWPGDLNNDHYTDVSDLLPIGYFYGHPGPIRPYASLEWKAQPAPLWGFDKTSTSNDAYQTFVDANADGVINLADQAAIGFNLGTYHEYLNNTHLREATLKDTKTPALNVVITEDTISSSALPKRINVSIMAGSKEAKIDSLYGTAFEIQFDPQYVKTSQLTTDYSGSVMGVQGTDFIYIEDKANIKSGKLGIGMTRFANAPVTGKNSRLLNLNLLLKENAPAGWFTVKVIPIACNDQHGNSIRIKKGADSVFIGSGSSLIADSKISGTARELSVYPNPSSNRVNIDFFADGYYAYAITLTDETGKILLSKTGSAIKGENQALINLNDMASGIYFINLITPGESKRIKIAKF